MKKQLGSFLAAGLIMTASVAFGAVREGQFSVSPVVGGYVYDGGKQDLNSNLVLGARVGYNFTKSFGIEALFDYVKKTDSDKASIKDVTLIRYGGDILYHFIPDSTLVPYVAAGYSELNFDGTGINNKQAHGAFDYGAGVKYFLSDSFALRADVRHIIYKYSSTTYNNFEYTLGAYIPFGGAAPAVKPVAVAKPAPAPAPAPVAAPAPAPVPVPAPVVIPVPPADSDKDGVIDSLDKCPGTPQGVAVDANGCPVDSDKDGVADYLDKCPGTPAGVAVDANGCPVDSDKDGVADYLDKCPGTPAGVAVDANGCPVDSDKDGVADYLDKCPGTPAGVAVDANGCPVDSDKDGVPDYLDKCPDTPAGTKVGNDGCPEMATAQKAEAAKRFCDKPAVIAIAFDTGKADIKSAYHDELDAIGKFMKEFPSSKGTIEGHTDSDGNKDANVKLSQRRADSVRSYIINKFGIDSGRIVAKGFGSNKPVTSNSSAAGKAKNRRIEANFSCE